MTDREVMQQALEALESGLAFDAHSTVLQNLREALEQPVQEQVRPAEFIQMTLGKETVTGIPAYWAEWPSKEQAAHNKLVDNALRIAIEAAWDKLDDKPVACRFCHSKKGCWAWQCYHCGEIDDVQQPTPPAAQQAEPCIGKDPRCPCQDGDACHYKDCGGTKAWPVPQAEPLEYWNAVEGWVKIDEVREHFEAVNCGTIYKHGGEGRVPLYIAPPQNEWVGLTDEEIWSAYPRIGTSDSNVNPYQILKNARAIEAKLKERNHG
jgi:hypothetical protein